MVHKNKKFEYQFNIAKKPPFIQRLGLEYTTSLWEARKDTISKKIKLSPEEANKKYKELKKKGLLVSYDFSTKQERAFDKKALAEHKKILEKKAGWL
jgi:hypothetical protein